MQQRKLIILDFFGVLVPRQQLDNGLKRLVPGEVQEKWLKYSVGQMSGKEFWHPLFPAQAEKELFSAFQVDPDWDPTFTKLSVRYDFAIVSNAPRDWRDPMVKLGLSRHFMDIVLSGDVGVRKPARQLLLTAVQRCGYLPADAVVVDNQPGTLQIAKAMGMRTVAYGHLEGDLRIRKLSDLQRML